MVSIKDKLRELDSLGIKRHRADESQALKTKPDFLKDLNARVIENAFGSYLMREREFPPDTVHGVPIVDFLTICSHLSLVGKNATYATLSPQEIAFIDTETTGLAGGTGTYVFLTGIGCFNNDRFCISQFFMDDYQHEKAFLSAIAQALADKKALISFNGKSYDVPLLKTRFVLNRIKFDFDGLQHMDLLHAARRLWKKYVPQCNLTSIEEFVLGFQRDNDISGAEIPGIFFQFLQNHDYQPIKPVFQHNAMDIVSLVSISIRASQAFGVQDPQLPYDPFGIVKTYEDMGMFERAAQVCSDKQQLADEADALLLLLRFARHMKRLSRLADAEQSWLQIINKGKIFMPEPYIELAKCYEHHLNDYAKALEIIQRAQARVETIRELRDTSDFDWVDKELEYRKKRIIFKILQTRES
jgi:uncharacterized protein